MSEENQNSEVEELETVNENSEVDNDDPLAEIDDADYRDRLKSYLDKRIDESVKSKTVEIEKNADKRVSDAQSKMTEATTRAARLENGQRYQARESLPESSIALFEKYQETGKAKDFARYNDAVLREAEERLEKKHEQADWDRQVEEYDLNPSNHDLPSMMLDRILSINKLKVSEYSLVARIRMMGMTPDQVLAKLQAKGNPQIQNPKPTSQATPTIPTKSGSLSKVSPKGEVNYNMMSQAQLEKQLRSEGLI